MNEKYNPIRASFAKLQEIYSETETLTKDLEKILWAVKPEIEEVSSALRGVKDQLDHPPVVTIALLGSTGAGKSTLINSLVGGEILPNSGINVCTSGITRVKYLDQEDFSITVKFATQESWNSEIENVIREIQAAHEDDSDENNKMEVHPSNKEETARLIAIYGRENYSKLISTRNMTSLVLPGKVLQAFSEGTRKITAKTHFEVLNLVNEFLVTKRIDDLEESADQLWPIVESVLIEGRFAAIQHGAEIVDLPGINDPNEAREARTREYLTTAKFIFVAYESKRQPTKDIYDILKTRNLRNTIVASGTTKSLTFIATKSDVFTPNDQELRKLGENVTLDAKARFRKGEVDKNLKEALHTIALEVSEAASTKQDAEMIQESISNSPRFVTSAYNFTLHELKSLGKEIEELPRFKNVDDTDINRLRAHIEKLTIKDGPELIFNRISNELRGVTNQILLMLNLGFAKFIMHEKSYNEKVQALQARIDTLTSDLDSDIDSLSKNLETAIQNQSEDFFLKIQFDARAIIRVRDDFARDLQSLHWATLRATTARGGRFWSPTFGEIDLIEAVAHPITEQVTGPWANFFGQSIKTTLGILSERINEIAETYIADVRKALDASIEVGDVESIIKPLLQNISEISQSKLQSTDQALQAEIKATRSKLVEMIRKTVEKQLRPVILSVSSERGSGMKFRMTSQILATTIDVIPNTFDSVKSEIKEVVQSSLKQVDMLVSEISNVIARDSRKIQSLFSEPRDLEKPFDLEEFNSLKKNVDAILLKIENSNFSQLAPQEDAGLATLDFGKLLIVDGSNIATFSVSETKKAGSLKKLQSCDRALQIEYPSLKTTIFVDANFKYLLSDKERNSFEAQVRDGLITEAPGGEPADVIMLELAKRTGSNIVSSDRFRDWRNSYPLINDPGRIIAPTYVSNSDTWIFRERRGGH